MASVIYRKYLPSSALPSGLTNGTDIALEMNEQPNAVDAAFQTRQLDSSTRSEQGAEWDDSAVLAR